MRDFDNVSQSPSGDALAVVASNTVALLAAPTGNPTQYTRGLYVGVTGDVTVITRKAQTVLFKAVPAGTILPIQVTHVKATGTTATDMVALY